MMAIFLLLGMFMDWFSIMLLTMPIFAPTVTALGYDLIWFGVLFNITMQVGYLSPPFGQAAFYLKSVAPPEISLNHIFVSLLPFIGLQIVGLADRPVHSRRRDVAAQSLTLTRGAWWCQGRGLRFAVQAFTRVPMVRACTRMLKITTP